jgi:glycosyltransferase involved in cell wall biosynthesis
MVARPIKVIQMLPELEEGGVEQGTLELGEYLAKNGHTSMVISQGGRMVPQLEKEGSSHITFRYIGEKSPRPLMYIIPLRQFLIKERVDILHLRSRVPAWVGYLVWKSLPVKKRPKLVTTFHGFYSINKYSEVMAKGEKVIAVSKIVAEHITNTYRVSPKKIVVIPRGFDEKRFNPDKVSDDRIRALKKHWSLLNSTLPVIIFPARLTRLKGHDLFLKSIARLTHLPWMAVCVGDIDEKSSYTALIKNMLFNLKLENRIRLVGHCDDMPAALRLSDVVISTSKSPESFGRTVVEAQAMGKPVIAPAHGGSLETVLDKKTGWLFKPGDSEALTNVLMHVISDKGLRESVGELGRKWVTENFTSKKMCKETVDLYRLMLMGS